MLTNFGDVDAAQRATKNGAYAYLVKSDTDVRTLDQVCRKGVKSQKVRRARHQILGLECTRDVLRSVRDIIEEIFDPPGYCFAYVPIEPGNVLAVRDIFCRAGQSRLSDNVQHAAGFLPELKAAEWVRTNRLPWLKTNRQKSPRPVENCWMTQAPS